MSDERKKTISYETEKYVLASLIKNEEKILDYICLVKECWFEFELHKIIFRAIHALLNKKFSVNSTTLRDYFHNISLKQFEGTDISDYVDGWSDLIDLKESSINDYIENLKKYYIARTIYDSARKLQKDILKNINGSSEDLIKVVNSQISIITTDEVSDSLDTIDLFVEAESILDKEDEEEGIVTPFPIFNSFYGELAPGNSYCIVADYGAGKSTILDFIAKKCPLMPENNCKSLYLDTELYEKLNVSRMMGSATGVNEYLFRTKKYKNDEELEEKAKKVLKFLKKKENLYHYKRITNAEIGHITSIIRRWHNKYIKEGETALVVLDYMKIMGESLNDAWSEFNILGQKADILNQLAREIGNMVILYAAQTNASGAMAASRKISNYASNIFFLHRKTPEELSEHGEDYGTHCLRADKTRLQGEGGNGFREFIKVDIGNGKYEYRKNFINYNFDNFKVSERGTYQDILDIEAGQLNI